MSRNFLAAETSPYLLQHQDNPVAWRPWGEAALTEAKRTGKPILLSVGYAACHWCHVMAHESFEDEAVAAVMNDLFVNIKVDREERPDIDAIYMSALHLLGEQGGWPLTMFLTPDAEPFWGGTEFPREPRFGRPGFVQVLTEIARLFREDPERIGKNQAALTTALAAQAAQARPGDPPADLLDRVAERLVGLMDPAHGGIKGAPKFPQCQLFELLWRAYLRTGHRTYADAVTTALDHICEGGIYDHLGGGFARYAVDERWLAPHFEKMLYDNAALIELMTLVWRHTANPRYAVRIEETIDWCLREMGTPGGGFAASLDADSDGEEGKFYVWREAEIDACLASLPGPLRGEFKATYDVTPAGNWSEAGGGQTILNRLALADTPWDADLHDRLAPARTALLAARTQRIRPGWDDKVLSDWNGLMIAGLTEAAMAFGRADWLAAAARAFRFVTESMCADGRLAHSWRAGERRHRAMADGLANIARAALVLYEATGERAYIEAAAARIDELDRYYWDAANGGYFYTASDAPDLITRTRTAQDNAQPAANGTLPAILIRLYLATGEARYRARADAVIRAFGGEVQHNFFPLGSYLNSVETVRAPVAIVLIGAAGDPRLQALRRTVFAAALPNRFLSLLAPGEPLPPDHPAAGKQMQHGAATAYVCVGETCSLPVTDPQALSEQLARAARGAV